MAVWISLFLSHRLATIAMILKVDPRMVHLEEADLYRVSLAELDSGSTPDVGNAERWAKGTYKVKS